MLLVKRMFEKKTFQISWLKIYSKINSNIYVHHTVAGSYPVNICVTWYHDLSRVRK